jgi:triosephosphate isomerase
MDVLIAGNWKMNLGPSQAVGFIENLVGRLPELPFVKVAVFPPFISIPAVAHSARGHPIHIGAQNCHYMDKGAYTGEISPYMLVEYCEYVILGHSERRSYFGETDDLISQKVRAALDAGLKVILCVGETKEQREGGVSWKVVEGQLFGSLLTAAPNPDPNRIVIAYEPVWAIGTGVTATRESALDMANNIKQKLGSSFSVLYGGSVNSRNCSEFIEPGIIDGLLVGGASVNLDEFIGIINAAVGISFRRALNKNE